MKTMRTIFACLASFIAMVSVAADLTPERAVSAYKRWAAARRRIGCDFSQNISSATAYTTSKTNLLYILKLDDGKTVFTSGSSVARPVIAWTSDPNVKLDKGSPLLALLEKDLAWRAAAGASFMDTDTSVPIASTNDIDDLRVAPFVKTQWGQTTTVTEEHCFDYYTPSVEDERTPCGCVATAMAQLMRYWEWPSADYLVTQETVTCTAPINLFGAKAYTNLTIQGGTYNWSKMDEIPGSDLETCKAIGKLTSDCGISVAMSYDFDGSGIPSTEARRITNALVENFGYSNAVMCTDEKLLSDRRKPATISKTILANLDAKCPVILLIIGGMGGHAVVADGYGFSGDAASPYVHLNMGWSGQNDVWYNLPEINVSDNPENFKGFDTVSGVGYNIFPESNDEIVSGRVLDADGTPAAGIFVRAYNGDYENANIHSELVAQTVTDENGVYALFVPHGESYDIYAKNDTGFVADAYTRETMKQSTYWQVGNSWGNDMVLEMPRVRVGSSYFVNFTSALKEVQRLEMDGGPVPIVELLRPVTVASTITIGQACEIRTADGLDPRDCTINFTDGAFFKINGQKTVLFTNVVFASDSDMHETKIEVCTNSVCAIAGLVEVDKIVLDYQSNLKRGKLEIAGKVESAIVIDSPKFDSSDKVFATVRAGVSYDDLAVCAPLFGNANNDELGGTVSVDADSGYILVWGDSECPKLAAVASLSSVSSPGDVVYYRSLRLLFANVTNDVIATLLKSSLLAEPVVLTNGVALKSAPGEQYSIWFDKAGAFTIKTNGVFEACDVVFKNGPAANTALRTVTNPFMVFDGGKFVLGDGAVISGLESAQSRNSVANGTVYVNRGVFEMQAGSMVTNCTSSADGGAVYLSASEESIFNFLGGSIAGCTAAKKGGAVYASNGATVNLSGDAIAYGNTSGSNMKTPDDIYVALASGEQKLVNVSGPLTGVVGLTYSATGNNTTNGPCAKLDGWTNPDAATLAAIVRSSAPLDYEAKVSEEDGAVLVWAGTDKREKPVPEVLANFRVIQGAETNCFIHLASALSLLYENDVARIVLLHDADFTNNVSSAQMVEARGSLVLDGLGHTLSRKGSWTVKIPHGSSLTLTNITLSAAHAYGDPEDASGGSVMYFYACGGNLTLDAGSTIREVRGDDVRAAGAVLVGEQGTFTMNPGAAILNCTNLFVNKSGGTGCGGGVLADKAFVVLNGGTISGCAADRGGGINMANESTLRISGDVLLAGNTDLHDNMNNLVVENGCELVLADTLTGTVGCTDGVRTDTNVIGVVGAEYFAVATTNELVSSAVNFVHDVRGVTGLVATNETGAILVWSDACNAATKTYSDKNGIEYFVVGEVPLAPASTLVPCKPFTFTSIVETADGKWRLTLAPGVGYCTYSLYTSDTPKTATAENIDAAWGAPVAVTNLVTDGDFTFEVESSAAKKFWAAKGEDGEK